MLHRLSVLMTRLQDDPDALLRDVGWPVLVWDSMPSRPRSVAPEEAPTLMGPAPPRVVESMVFELRPRYPGRGPAVTVGRSPECDIVLPEPTVSRQHARFRPEPHTEVWSVTDLESHGGTYLEGVLVVPGRPSPLFTRASLRLGGAEVVFLQACAFERYVRSYATQPRVRLTRPG
ncbi:FHA domain-containing protein [Myxococcus stipitatus]|uniref:FHA domain-containing protein n=1 Tax=Myxococcus stipitatus TaxID=83455 RepID=UPI0030D3DD9D